MPQGLAQYLERVVGPHTPVALHARAGRGQVLEVIDGEGTKWVGKWVPSLGAWRREVRAYRNWVPRFADQAPRLVAADQTHQMFILTGVPGEPGETFTPELHREAGRLLRRIHQSRPPRTGDESPARITAERLEWELAQCTGGFSADEVEWARTQTGKMYDLPAGPMVPCHGDFGAHNWVQHETDPIRIIDFSASRWHVRAFDLTRLFFGPWWERPDLIEAFFDGYGRHLEDEEFEFLRLHLATTAISSIRWARRHAIPNIEQKSRYRLTKLMAGHDFTNPPSALRRARRRVLPNRRRSRPSHET